MLKQTLNKGISTPIAIGIVLILVIVVGTFTWLQYGEMWKEESELSEIEIPGKEEIADWKDYRNEEYGFEVSYPINWRVVGNWRRGEPDIILCPPEFFSERNDGWRDSGCASKRRIWLQEYNNTILIEGIGEVSEEEYKEKWEEKINKPFFNIYLFFEKTEPPAVLWKFQADLDSFPEYKEIYKQMESSFKLLSESGEKQKNVEQVVNIDYDEANWEIYKNEAQGYEIKYPEGFYIFEFKEIEGRTGTTKISSEPDPWGGDIGPHQRVMITIWREHNSKKDSLDDLLLKYKGEKVLIGDKMVIRKIEERYGGAIYTYFIQGEEYIYTLRGESGSDFDKYSELIERIEDTFRFLD